MKELKVIIAEDKSVTAIDLSNILGKMGFEVSAVVKTGEEAIAKIKQNTPDLILMDIMLKGYYTGIEAAEIIKRSMNIPIIFITALIDDETYLKAYSTNPSAIIMKPFTEDVVKYEVLQAVKSSVLKV